MILNTGWAQCAHTNDPCNKVALGAIEFARLHNGTVQVQIMRHYRRADDADREVEHCRIGYDLPGRKQCRGNLAHIRLRQYQLECEAATDDAQQRHY